MNADDLRLTGNLKAQVTPSSTREQCHFLSGPSPSTLLVSILKLNYKGRILTHSSYSVSPKLLKMLWQKEFKAFSKIFSNANS